MCIMVMVYLWWKYTRFIALMILGMAESAASSPMLLIVSWLSGQTIAMTIMVNLTLVYII